MKRILLYTVLFLLLCCISSCLDDKNDFNYRQINELNGSIENMNGWYTVSVEEDLYLKPTFKFTIDSIHPDVSYEWYLDGELLDVKTPDYTFNNGAFSLFGWLVNTIGKGRKIRSFLYKNENGEA